MSGFGDEAEILRSTRALPVVTPSGLREHPIIARLAHEVARIVNERDFRQRMYIDRAVEPSGIRLEEFARFIRDERETAERIVRESGLQPK